MDIPVEQPDEQLPNFEQMMDDLAQENLHKAMVTDHEEAAVHYLNLELRGKTIDPKYEAYVVAKLKQYFEKHRIEDAKLRFDIAESAMKSHVRYKLCSEQAMFMQNPSMIEAVNHYNRTHTGTYVDYPWYLMGWPRATKMIDPNSDTCYNVPKPPSLLTRSLLIIGAGTLSFVALRYISRRCCNHLVGFIIQAVPKQPQLPSPSAIIPSSSEIMIPIKSLLSDITSVVSSANQFLGPVKDMFRVLLLRAGVDSMNSIYLTWIPGGE